MIARHEQSGWSIEGTPAELAEMLPAMQGFLSPAPSGAGPGSGGPAAPSLPPAAPPGPASTEAGYPTTAMPGPAADRRMRAGRGRPKPAPQSATPGGDGPPGPGWLRRDQLAERLDMKSASLLKWLKRWSDDGRAVQVGQTWYAREACVDEVLASRQAAADRFRRAGRGAAAKSAAGAEPEPTAPRPPAERRAPREYDPDGVMVELGVFGQVDEAEAVVLPLFGALAIPAGLLEIVEPDGERVGVEVDAPAGSLRLTTPNDGGLKVGYDTRRHGKVEWCILNIAGAMRALGVARTIGVFTVEPALEDDALVVDLKGFRVLTAEHVAAADRASAAAGG